ncbi:MAG TPA: hypothetical protein VMB49_11890 [Acidobacteriaceae bacterium]|nr:hypothetical protein [Acidobacteriaceae bacterium]
MRTKVQFLSFDEILNTLRTSGFDVQDVPGVANQVLVTKYGAGAILIHAPEPEGAAKKLPHMAIRWRERPGYVVNGEVATLLDRGFQKFWKTSRIELPATAQSLQSVHRFAEELRQVVGEQSLYNESLGTTSDSYLYDRVKGRDLPLAERPVPAWQAPAKA